jgi:phage-related protein
MEFTVEFYKRGDKSPVHEFILSLDEEFQLDVFAMLRRLQENPFSLGAFSKKMEGIQNLFEVRVKGRNRAVRVFYCFKKGRTIVLLHAFAKKTQKTPLREIEIASRRVREVEN